MPTLFAINSTILIKNSVIEMASKFVLALSLSLFVCGAFSETCRTAQLSEQQLCRFDRINAAQPTERIQSEGGVTELWDERADQFQCAGVAPMRNILKPNGLSLPNYHSTPRLVFIERGQGWISITFPGCKEFYHSPSGESIRPGSQGQEQETDLHQKVHRIRKGDIIALPAGAAHWCFNDGNEELVAVSINDLNHKANQLDQNFRAFYLAGGVPRSEQGQDKFQNIFRALDPQLLAESYNLPQQLVQQMQSAKEERGLSVIVKEPMRFVRAGEAEEDEAEQQQRGQTANSVDFSESLCSMKIKINIDNRREADVYTRGAGKVFVVDRNKLPAFHHMDMSAERGLLYQNAFLSPIWEKQGHAIMYATRGDAKVQIVNHKGQSLMNDRVNKGDMFVVPQFFTITIQGGNDGFEWVSLKTTGWPMGSSLAGYSSVLREMPLDVITNAYQISPTQAQALKMNRGGQTFLLSPGRMQSQRQD